MFDPGGHFFSPVMGVIGIQKILNDCSLFEPLWLHQGIIYAYTAQRAVGIQPSDKSLSQMFNTTYS